MDAAMIEKIDAVLDRVKDPETLLSMAELGWVERIRHDEVSKRLFVFTKALGPRKKFCTVIGGLQISSAMKTLKEELHKEFPNLAIEFA